MHGKLQRQQSIWHKNKLSLLRGKLQRQKWIWQRKRQSNCLQTSSCPKLARQQSIWHKNKLSLLERNLERQQSIWQRKRQSNCLQTSSCPKLSISCRAKIPMSYLAEKIVHNYAYNLPPMFSTFTFLLLVVLLYSVLLAKPSFISSSLPCVASAREK